MRQLPSFRDKLNQLLTESGKTIGAFAEFLGTSRQSMWYYLKGERIPDALMVKQICDRCNVSADWLLGLSEVKKPDADLQAVSTYMGLSPASIEAISNFDQKEILDAVLSGNQTRIAFYTMLYYLNQARQREHPAPDADFLKKEFHV